MVGRGFALLHDPDTGASVDTAEFPWTLDNPAYGWFGLSTAARVRVGEGVRAVSVAEVVSPTEALSGPLARDLMVALVRAGVTATCGSADKPRYGYLDVDSNLPDTRIALGGPGQNVFTKAVLAEADPVYTAELERQLAATGMARVWVPAAREFTPLDTAWVVRRRPAPAVCAAGTGSRRPRRVRPRRRRAFVGRRPRRRRDRRQPAGAAAAGGLRTAHCRPAEPGNAQLRRRHRRHLAHGVDAVVHRLAVGHLDRRAAADCAGRLELPAAALDTRLRLRTAVRRR